MKGATVKTKDGHCQGKRESAIAKPLRSILDIFSWENMSRTHESDAV